MLETITVLYIENDISISEEVVFILSKKVKTVHVAFNGREGLELFQKFRPDIIITDIEMPKLNGLDMVKKIRAVETNIPIIITSAFTETDKLLQAIDLGVDSYLTKPINLKVLFEKIENLTKSIFLEKKLETLKRLENKEKELINEKIKTKELLEEQKFLLSLFDKGESVLFKWKNDENWTVEYVSNNVEKLLPGSFDSLNLGLVPYDSFMNKDDLDGMMDVVEIEIAEKRDSFSPKIYRITTSQNVTKWVLEHTVTQKDSNGNISHFIGSVIDITDKKLTEKKIEDYLTLIDEHIATVSTDLNGIIIDVSSAFCRLSGYKKDELIGHEDKVLKSNHIEDVVQKNVWQTIEDNKIYSGELKNIRKDGSTFWVNLKVLPIVDENNIKTGYLIIKHDITDKKTIEELSITDDLTKLYNRRYFKEVFKKELLRAKRDEKYLVFMMFDIDWFKLYNDTYGHQSGDNALRDVAKALKKFTNRAGDYAFRLGGEEFGIILSLEDKEKTKAYALNLLETIESLHIVHEKNTASKYITASIGVVFKDYNSNLTLDDLYLRADSALYKAKENGRNQVAFN